MTGHVPRVHYFSIKFTSMSSKWLGFGAPTKISIPPPPGPQKGQKICKTHQNSMGFELKPRAPMGLEWGPKPSSIYHIFMQYTSVIYQVEP